MSIGVGVRYAKPVKEYQLMVDNHNISLYIEKNPEFSETMMYKTTGLPVLLSFHMGVRSTRKLAIKGAESKE